MLVSITVQIIGLVWAGWVVATLMSIMGRIDAKQEVRNQRQEQINALIRLGGVPRKLRRGLAAWVDTAPLPVVRHEEVLDKLPAQLRRDVLLAVHSKAIGQIEMLNAMVRKSKDLVAALAYKMQPLNLDAGAFVFTQGAPVKEFYMLTKGTVALVVGNKITRYFSAGDHFGDFDLFYSSSHTVSAQAVEPCGGFVLPGDFVQDMCRKHAMFGRFLRITSKQVLEQVAEVVDEDRHTPDRLSIITTLQRARGAMMSTLSGSRRGASSGSTPAGLTPGMLARLVAASRTNAPVDPESDSGSDTTDILSSSDSDTEVPLEVVRSPTAAAATAASRAKELSSVRTARLALDAMSSGARKPTPEASGDNSSPVESPEPPTTDAAGDEIGTETASVGPEDEGDFRLPLQAPGTLTHDRP